MLEAGLRLAVNEHSGEGNAEETDLIMSIVCRENKEENCQEFKVLGG